MNTDHVKNLNGSSQRSVRFLTGILILAAAALGFLGVSTYRAEMAVNAIKERQAQMQVLHTQIIYFNDMLTMAARMAASTEDSKWEQIYHQFEPQLSNAIARAVTLSPEVYRNQADRSEKGSIQAVEHMALSLIRSGRSKEALGMLLGSSYEENKHKFTHAMERRNKLFNGLSDADLMLEISKENLTRIAFISVLILLLLAWLFILRIARQAQEALIKSNYQLDFKTHELAELNAELDNKVKERTASLQTALDDIQKSHQALQNAQMQLLQSEKFAAIGQLAAGVAHEINNPVGFINSNLQTLEQYVVHYSRLLGILNKLEKALKEHDHERSAEVVLSWEKIRQETNFAFIDDDVGHLIKESREGAEKISRIITDLRAFASPDKGMIESINVEALMDSMINIVWNEIKYKATVEKSYGEVPFIVCNPQKIGQVFVNLLINAAHAIKDKGTIYIKTYKADDSVCIDVSDTGSGIPSEYKTRIFDPFFTTKAPGKGIGLGLSICYDIIRKHGGNIAFDSIENKGTTFTVKLPVRFAYDWAGL